jgi:hypothetical protein
MYFGLFPKTINEGKLVGFETQNHLDSFANSHRRQELFRRRCRNMPPKKKDQPKAGPKVAVDKTFGLKNVAPLSLIRELF